MEMKCMMANRRDFLKGALCIGSAMAAANVGAHPSSAQVPADVAFKDLQTIRNLSDGGRVYALASRIDHISLSTVFVSPEGKVLVVDGGFLYKGQDGKFLGDFLKKIGGHVDYWFITHAHNDH